MGNLMTPVTGAMTTINGISWPYLQLAFGAQLLPCNRFRIRITYLQGQFHWAQFLVRRLRQVRPVTWHHGLSHSKLINGLIGLFAEEDWKNLPMVILMVIYHGRKTIQNHSKKKTTKKKHLLPKSSTATIKSKTFEQWKNPGCLRYAEDEKLQSCVMYNKPWNKDPVIKQPVFHGK